MAVMERKRRHSRVWTGLQRTGKTLGNGEPELGRPIVVNCFNHDAIGLCEACLDDFRLVLADVPWLLDDLDVAIAGLAEFVERGFRRGEGESTGGGGNPAVAAHHRLVSALDAAAGWFDQRHPEQLAVMLLRTLDQLVDEPALRKVAREVSAAAARTHRVIDAPRQLWYYGPCPECRVEIWQERIHKDDDETPVECRGCDYAATVVDHNKGLLDAAEDSWLTITELVSAITSAGEVVTRKQIEGWIRHHGLAREARARDLEYVNGRLASDQVWTYRLGDVRERALESERKRTNRGLTREVAPV